MSSLGRFLTELWIFRQSASGACFYRKSILFACLPMIDIILNQKGMLMTSIDFFESCYFNSKLKSRAISPFALTMQFIMTFFALGQPSILIAISG
jgi:hypothetical protein